jgi:ATP-dependent DNA ligase
MEAKLVESLPEGAGWQFEPKWDGFRCLAFRAGDEIALQSRTAKPLGRYFPEIEALLRALPASRFVVDGELAIPLEESLSFDALQMRLHPAESRVRRLAAETPAVLILFDCLVTPAGARLLEHSLLERREALEEFHRAAHEESGPAAARLRLSPYTRQRREARRWLENARGALDGVVAKRLADPYQPGERAMIKVKPLRTADCVVGGFRYGTGSREVGSLLLGLYDEEGKLHHVGFTSTIPHAERRELTKRLQALIEPPGFTGDAPGGPSRWSTERTSEWEPLRAKLVVEVVYDQVTGNRFRHGTRLTRWRPDKSPHQCTFEQLQREVRPGKLIREIVRA